MYNQIDIGSLNSNFEKNYLGKMATLQSTAQTSTYINVAKLKLYVDMIRIFNGNPNNQFFRLATFSQINDAHLKMDIVKGIHSKLVGNVFERNRIKH